MICDIEMKEEFFLICSLICVKFRYLKKKEFITLNMLKDWNIKSIVNIFTLQIIGSPVSFVFRVGYFSKCNLFSFLISRINLSLRRVASVDDRC